MSDHLVPHYLLQSASWRLTLAENSWKSHQQALESHTRQQSPLYLIFTKQLEAERPQLLSRWCSQNCTLLAKGTGSPQLPLTVSFRHFLRRQSAELRFMKVSIGATLVSCPLQMVNFLLSYRPAITCSILATIEAAMGVLATRASSSAQSSTNMQFWMYLISPKSLYVNCAGIALPKLRSQTTTSYSSTMPAMLPSAGDSPNSLPIFSENTACSSSSWAAWTAMAYTLLAIKRAWLGQEGKQTSSCFIGTGWYPWLKAKSPAREGCSSEVSSAEVSKGGRSRSLDIPEGILYPFPIWNNPAAWPYADQQHLSVLSVKISTSLGRSVPLKSCSLSMQSRLRQEPSRYCWRMPTEVSLPWNALVYLPSQKSLVGYLAPWRNNQVRQISLGLARVRSRGRMRSKDFIETIIINLSQMVCKINLFQSIFSLCLSKQQ